MKFGFFALAFSSRVYSNLGVLPSRPADESFAWCASSHAIAAAGSANVGVMTTPASARRLLQ